MVLQQSKKFLNTMKDVREGGTSAWKAEQKWELRKSTLHDRLNGSVNFDHRKGPSPVLTKAKENQFPDWLIQLANPWERYFKNFWVGMLRKDPGTLSLYQS